MTQYLRRYSVVMSKWHFTWCWNAFITLVTLHNSKLPECIYTEGHIAFIPGWFALKHMYMSDCTFAMSDCISQMLETHFGSEKMSKYCKGFRVILRSRADFHLLSHNITSRCGYERKRTWCSIPYSPWLTIEIGIIRFSCRFPLISIYTGNESRLV